MMLLDVWFAAGARFVLYFAFYFIIKQRKRNKHRTSIAASASICNFPPLCSFGVCLFCCSEFFSFELSTIQDYTLFSCVHSHFHFGCRFSKTKHANDNNAKQSNNHRHERACCRMNKRQQARRMWKSRPLTSSKTLPTLAVTRRNGTYSESILIHPNTRAKKNCCDFLSGYCTRSLVGMLETWFIGVRLISSQERQTVFHTHTSLTRTLFSASFSPHKFN